MAAARAPPIAASGTSREDAPSVGKAPTVVARAPAAGSASVGWSRALAPELAVATSIFAVDELRLAGAIGSRARASTAGA